VGNGGEVRKFQAFISWLYLFRTLFLPFSSLRA
jgi:hypothetical protein